MDFELPNESEMLLEHIFDITQRMYLTMSGEVEEGVDDKSHFRLFHLFAELGRTLVSADRCSFWKWDKRMHQLVTTAAVGEERIVIDEGTGLVGRALREEQPVVTNDPYNCPDFNSSVDKRTGYVTKSILVMPVRNVKGEIIGAYQAINKLGDGGFNIEEDCKRLSLATLICGLSLESDIFLDDSQRDKLTDLKNRMGFTNEYGPRFLRYMKEKAQPVSLVICDIDFFKKVNDTYGHNAGDAVLKHVASMLHGSIRESDEVYRWGGEEFIIMLAGVDSSLAASVADRIRMKIQASTCSFEATDIKVTMSFGCADVEPEKSAEDNVKVADARLYRAKETGRNRVVNSDDV